MNLTEFLLARKIEATEADLIAEASVDAFRSGIPAEQTSAYVAAMTHTTYAEATRLARAVRNLGWVMRAALIPSDAKREAARWSDHPDYRDEWKP